MIMHLLSAIRFDQLNVHIFIIVGSHYIISRPGQNFNYAGVIGIILEIKRNKIHAKLPELRHYTMSHNKTPVQLEIVKGDVPFG